MVKVKHISLSVGIAFVLWTFMFCPYTAGLVNFWLTMTIAALTLTAFVTFSAPRWWQRIHFSLKNLVVGVALAAGLWVCFWVGDKVAGLLFTTARPEINAIYDIKNGVSPLLLSLLLLVLIGPAEEIFWRGYVQEQLSQRIGKNRGFLIATALYTAVHMASCNFMLIMAALVAGLFWGLLYRFRPQDYTAIIISHALWDAAVFIWFPIM